MSQVLTGANLALGKIGTEQSFEVLKALLALLRYSMKKGRIRKLFIHLLRERHFLVTLLNSTPILQLVLLNSQSKAHIRYEKSVKSVLEAQLYFQGPLFLCRKITNRKLRIVQNAMIGSLACMAVQLEQKNWLRHT